MTPRHKRLFTSSYGRERLNNKVFLKLIYSQVYIARRSLKFFKVIKLKSNGMIKVKLFVRTYVEYELVQSAVNYDLLFQLLL